MGDSLVRYQPLFSDAQEQIAFSRLQTGWTSMILFTHQKLLPLDRSGKIDLALSAFDQSQGADDDLTRSAGELVRITHAQSVRAVQNVEQASRVATLIALAVTILAIGVATSLGLLLSRAIMGGIGALEVGTTAVASGDLSYTVVVGGDDELSSLAAAFNHMTSDLRAQHAAIKQREDELRQSLETQNQLFATVRQLSTPILPVADGVIVLPLVGHIDTRRAQDIMTVLLQGVAAERARVAILDITGVAAVDTHVLGRLLGAMRGAELLGARSLLAGISAEVAQLIATQGITLGNLSSYRDLHDAIAAALDLSYDQTADSNAAARMVASSRWLNGLPLCCTP